jgi:hypothetical protein
MIFSNPSAPAPDAIADQGFPLVFIGQSPQFLSRVETISRPK